MGHIRYLPLPEIVCELKHVGQQLLTPLVDEVLGPVLGFDPRCNMLLAEEVERDEHALEPVLSLGPEGNVLLWPELEQGEQAPAVFPIELVGQLSSAQYNSQQSSMYPFQTAHLFEQLDEPLYKDSSLQHSSRSP